jgi:hypothetical protein
MVFVFADLWQGSLNAPSGETSHACAAHTQTTRRENENRCATVS